jgi:predicted DCC family thiol-disulfide oxidoreductase YuxK
LSEHEIEVFFDGDCPLCTQEMAALRRLDRAGRIGSVRTFARHRLRLTGRGQDSACAVPRAGATRTLCTGAAR